MRKGTYEVLNLIRRDAILQKKQLFIFLPFILFFVVLGMNPIFIFLVASIFIPFNAYAYDEKAETNILLNSLPYTRKEIITARYLGAVIYMVLSIGLASLVMFIFNKPFALTDIAIGTGLFLLFAALTFPLFQVFKPGSITTVILISFVLLTWLMQWILSNAAEHIPSITDFIASVSAPALYGVPAFIILVIYAASWTVSTVIYERKAF